MNAKEKITAPTTIQRCFRWNHLTDIFWQASI
jgi:hypothetical protein